MSTNGRTYLDYNATAPLRPQARDAFVRVLEHVGNASSVHREGRAARGIVETARDAVGALVGGKGKNVIFTGSGSEANNLVLAPGFQRAGASEAMKLLVGAGEHPCVLEGHRFPVHDVEHIPLDADGIVDLAWLDARLADLADTPVLVSIQLANNETGAVQPIAEAAALVRARGGLMHCDAVQAAGKVAVDIDALGVDALTLSAHKLGGPQGVGALVLAGEGYVLDRLVRGGGQERNWRAGTENVAGIAAFGEAARVAREALAQEEVRLAVLRAAFEGAIREICPDAVIFSEKAPRLPNTILFAVPGKRAETALIALDLNGAALSSGSACSSGKVKRSHVLDAMGVDPALAEAALRLSFGWNTQKEDVTHFTAAFARLLSNRNQSSECAA
ncbi:MAG: cysteine desulfurase [Salinarimonas sp.]|nr:cysteine desulfurase [Salinarimonas sp.]